jgi:hydrogenase/urease accessory protein HupE
MSTSAGPFAMALSWMPLAHLTPTGLGPWGDGMARLVLQPTDLLLLIGLVLLGAQGGRASADRLPLLFPFAWLLGGLAGLTLIRTEWLLALPCMAAVTAVGLLTALGVRLRPTNFLLLSSGMAIAFGMVAGSALAGHQGALPALLGEAVAIAVLTTLLLLPLAPPHPRWLAIGLQVGGSWITASGLLMLGWLVRHPR